MVTQGMRHRETLAVALTPESGNAGSVNPRDPATRLLYTQSSPIVAESS